MIMSILFVDEEKGKLKYLPGERHKTTGACMLEEDLTTISSDRPRLTFA